MPLLDPRLLNPAFDPQSFAAMSPWLSGAGGFGAPAPDPDAEAAAAEGARMAAANRLRSAQIRPVAMPVAGMPDVPFGGSPLTDLGAGGALPQPDAVSLPPAAAPTTGQLPASVMPYAEVGVSPAISPAVPPPRPAPGPPLDITPKAPQSSAAPPVPEASLFGRIGQVLGDNGLTLMALGGGMAGAPSWGTAISRGLTQAVPATALEQKQNLQQANIAATYRSLVAAGVEPAKALAAVYNPDILKQIATQTFGPKEAPKTTEWLDENGIKRTAYWDPQASSYRDMQTGKQVGQLGITQAPPSTSPFAVPPPPPGVDPVKWREQQAGKVAEEEKLLREKGEGSLEFLPDALRVYDKVKTRGGEAIGPYQGSEGYNKYIRAPLSALGSTEAAKNLGTFNELQADIKRLSVSNLKAQFGARPTNIDVQLNQQTFGGLQSADNATAASILQERIRSSFEVLGRNIQSGLVKPDAVPLDVAKRGIEMGMLDPKLFPGIAAAPQTQPLSPPPTASAAPAAAPAPGRYVYDPIAKRLVPAR